MAGGKLTPRQKMINLMYLVFIAMLALNMSKEVLTAFGNFNDKFDESNKLTEQSNETLLSALNTKASDEPAKYGESAKKAQEVSRISKEFTAFLEKVKAEVTEGIEVDKETGKLPFEAMDKSTIDEKWFAGDGYSARGTEIVSKIDKYVADIKKVLGNDVKYGPFIKEIEKKFSTADITDREGVKKKFLDYKTKGFPAVSTLTLFTSMQNDVKNTEAGAYNLFLGNALKQAASMKNFQAIVVLEKNAYFQGEEVKGKVVLGRYDANTQPTSFKGPGKIENGQAVISMTAGGVGEQNISGEFGFLEDGKEIPLKFEGKYVVVPRPNSANISADKMNVVYRGLPNPMTISFAGIAEDKVTASAPGLTSTGKGKYNLNPGSGTEVTITATGKLPDGKTVSDKKVFRIKNIPPPFGAIGGTTGTVKGSKSRLEVSQVSAKLEDFLYDLNFQVTQFTFKVPGQPAVIVNGDRVNAQCKAALARAGRGDVVTISDIKTKIVGVTANIVTGKTAPVVYEIQ
ncbi:type IX secretion system motor protein PorM/GldM [Flavobacterium suncheonense]|uniref:Gliding motility protein GldM n=1 Tax=Flavobacterium suncheonense GH29-5 = DSM 17707 TaxID=1121899 RepID=A0A0A2MBQ1_9FLAO|nr:gliding motility protein GldM [Flavobacterium suncheonense]KGO88898.1 gliding motility protein GldM [Flavobacterium suncheonense GH29-5 = DSM 17707]